MVLLFDGDNMANTLVDDNMHDTAGVYDDQSPRDLQEDTTPPGPLIKRRARKACVSCHDKKIRCDIQISGSFCTNCRLDHLTCQLRPRQPRRKTKTLDKCKRPNVHIKTDDPKSKDSSPLQAKSSRPRQSPVSETSFIVEPWATLPVADIVPPLAPDLLYSHYDIFDTESMSHIAPEDFAYLEQKKCFHLPVRKTLTECMQQYFRYVHPTLPLIDENWFWNVYSPTNTDVRPPKKMSLFVLRCMLFASSSFLSDAAMHTLGFDTHRELECAMYQRAKLLHDFKTLSDPLAQAQGSLLLTFHHNERDPSANTIWLRAAIQYATSIDAHQYENCASFTDSERLERKRLWWSCVIRDRILPLGLRRSIQITPDVFDFSQSPLTEADLASEVGCSQVYDGVTKMSLTYCFLSFLNLTIKLTDVILLICPNNGYHHMAKSGVRTWSQIFSRLEHCKTSLNWWLKSTQGTLDFLSSEGQQQKLVLLFHETSQIYCNSALAALYQYEITTLQMVDLPIDKRKEIAQELKVAINRIADSVGRIVRSGMTQYLPLSIVAYLAFPIVLSAFDMHKDSRFSPDQESDTKRQRFQIYNQVMKVYLSRFPAAETATLAYNKVIALAKESEEKAEQHEAQGTFSQRTDMSLSRDWCGLLVYDPRRYIRLTTVIDASLNHGSYPPPEKIQKQLQMMSFSRVAQPSFVQSREDLGGRGSLTVLDELAYVVEQQNTMSNDHSNMEYMEYNLPVANMEMYDAVNSYDMTSHRYQGFRSGHTDHSELKVRDMRTNFGSERRQSVQYEKILHQDNDADS